MALVIFLVFSTDLILPRISLPAAIAAPFRGQWLSTCRFS
jgi:hypothetical protein